MNPDLKAVLQCIILGFGLGSLSVIAVVGMVAFIFWANPFLITASQVLFLVRLMVVVGCMAAANLVVRYFSAN